MGKKVIVDLDLSRCVACYACVVACKDQHYDVDEQGPAFRKALRYENDQGVIKCISIGCMHCADSPCMAACPTGAIYRDEETGLVQVDSSSCIGCRSCLMACPFGAPKFTAENRMVKCDGCAERIKQGLEPVCVKTCPSGALFLREQNEHNRTDSLRRRVFGDEL